MFEEEAVFAVSEALIARGPAILPAMSSRGHSRLANLVEWLGIDNFSYVTKWVTLASLVGIAGGLAAVGVDMLLEYIQEHTEQVFGQTGAELAAGAVGGVPIWLLWLLIPASGGLVAGWMIRRWAPEAKGHGTEAMVKVFHEENGRVRRPVILIKGLASAATVGTGGSAGLEGPVAQLGSGIGSALADTFKMSDRDRRIFLLAGASAGIGALFTAPLGGALFAPEVLYKKAEFEGDAIIPCIISSIVAYTVFRTATGESRAIHLGPELLAGLAWGDPRQLGLYLMLALACALVGWLYVHVFDGVHTGFEKLSWPGPLKAAVGGVLLGGLALSISPFTDGHQIFFGGYDLIQSSIEGQIATTALLVLVLGKILATSLSISSGGSGGVFAPSLAVGAMLGAVLGNSFATAFPGLGVNPSSFALVGMGAFFTGVSKTPIAAILMVSEMTGGYELLAPLMLVSVANMLLSTRWTMYKSQVGGIVDSPAHSGDFVIDVLEGMRVEALLDEARRPTLVSERATLRQALEIVGNAAGTYFPVVDENQRMVGIFSLSDVRRIYGVSNIEDLVIVRDFMVDRVETVTPEDGLDVALKILNERSIHELPIVDSEDEGLVLGMMTRNVLGVAYQKRLRALRLRKGLDKE